MSIIEVHDYEAKWSIPEQAWKKFLDEAIDFESDKNNFKYEFGIMTKKYGQQFIEYCRASWITCMDIMAEEEFCKMNADMLIGFFKGKIKT